MLARTNQGLQILNPKVALEFARGVHQCAKAVRQSCSLWTLDNDSWMEGTNTSVLDGVRRTETGEKGDGSSQNLTLELDSNLGRSAREKHRSAAEARVSYLLAISYGLDVWLMLLLEACLRLWHRHTR